MSAAQLLQRVCSLPAMSTRDPAAVSLEVFVLQQLSLLAQECTGRGQAQKDVRDAALKLLGEWGRQGCQGGRRRSPTRRSSR